MKVSFQFGTTTAYGQSTEAQTTAPNNAATPFTAQLTGLPAGTTIHYRAVAVSDFGTFVGADQTLTTASTPTTTASTASAACGHAESRRSQGIRRDRDSIRSERERSRVVQGTGRSDMPARFQADRHRDAQRQEDPRGEQRARRRTRPARWWASGP